VQEECGIRPGHRVQLYTGNAGSPLKENYLIPYYGCVFDAIWTKSCKREDIIDFISEWYKIPMLFTGLDPILECLENEGSIKRDEKTGFFRDAGL
jgi:hypothetical protein